MVTWEKPKVLRYLIYLISAFIFTLINRNNLFFWDSVSQVSIPANFYFSNNFSSLLLPDSLSTGHPPFAGMYIAFIWKIFGCSLPVSHFAMLPFVFGILFQLDRIISRSGLKTFDSALVLLITICDATLLSQLSMVTFDILHIFFFLWAFSSILNGRRIRFTIAFALLMITSLRAGLSGFGLILFILFRSYRINKKISFSELIPVIPGISLLLVFFTWFLYQKGWVVFNPVSPDYRIFGGIATVPEILRNIGVVGWRLIDLGRVGLWIAFLALVIRSVRLRTLYDDFYSDMFLLALSQFLVFFSIVIFYKNPFGHRYFLPVIIPVSIAVAYWVIQNLRLKYAIYSFLLVCVISGYFWIYPVRISNGWDATPAHWAYFKVLNEMKQKITDAGIELGKVGSFFPVEGNTEFKDLNGNGIIIPEADPGHDDYILFSNVCNVSDEVIDELYDVTKWTPSITIKKGEVLMVLYKRKANL